MNSTLKIEIAALLFGAAVITAVIFYGDKVEEPTPDNNTVYVRDLAAENAAIDSVKGLYQAEIDRLQGRKIIYRDRIIVDTHAIDSLKAIADTICYPIIAAYDRKVEDLDSLCTVLDTEAMLYSEKLFLTEKQRTNDSLILSDFKRGYNELDSLYLLRGKEIKKQKKITKFAAVFGAVVSIIAIVK